MANSFRPGCPDHSKRKHFNKWDTWKATCKKVDWTHNIIPHTKITPKWINSLNIRDKNHKTLKRKQINPNDPGLGNGLIDIISKMSNKRKIDELDFIKMKNFVQKEHYHKSANSTHKMGKFANYIFHIGLVSRTYKEFLDFNNRE